MDVRPVGVSLLGPAELRAIAGRLGLRPAKQLGQHFVHDPNTVRRIVRTAELAPDEAVLEVGPGLGSLTLALLPVVAHVHAVEVDPLLAGALPDTVAERAAAYADRLTVYARDALDLAGLPEPAPTALVANLPYNVAVPVLLHLLAVLPSLRHGLVMVQREVADRLAAAPGSRVYGAPSAKLAWYAQARLAGRVPRSVFWPVPNVDSSLVAFTRRPPPGGADRRCDVGTARELRRGNVGTACELRRTVFTVVEAAFGQRRKTLRAALAGWAGGAGAAAAVLAAAGVPAGVRAESLTIEQFTAIAAVRRKGTSQ